MNNLYKTVYCFSPPLNSYKSDVEHVDVNNGILNMVEMAFRAYNPCFLITSHSLSVELPRVVNFKDIKGNNFKSV